MEIISTNSHIVFAESVTGLSFGPKTKQYLNNKYDHFQSEVKVLQSGDNWFIGRHIAHILMMPALFAALSIQTAVDAASVAALSIGNIFTFGCDSDLRTALAARTYNLFVADSLTWLSLIPSLSCYLAYDGAKSLHLGTTRSIDTN